MKEEQEIKESGREIYGGVSHGSRKKGGDL